MGTEPQTDTEKGLQAVRLIGLRGLELRVQGLRFKVRGLNPKL